jgi:hypothetical protein
VHGQERECVLRHLLGQMRIADDPVGGGIDEPEVLVHQLPEGFLGPVPRKRPQQFVIIHSDFVREFPPGGETERGIVQNGR